MSNPDEAPPSASSGSLRISTPDLPEEGEYATELPAPTYSSGYIGRSQQQFPAVGQRAVSTVEVGAPPPQTAVRPLVNSSNHIDNRTWGHETGGGGGSHSAFVHQNNSSPYGVDDPYSGGEAPGISGYAQRNRSNTGSSTNDMDFDPQAHAGFSLVGNKFKLANEKLNQYRPSN